jgi:hypothetical protein
MRVVTACLPTPLWVNAGTFRVRRRKSSPGTDRDLMCQ